MGVQAASALTSVFDVSFVSVVCAKAELRVAMVRPAAMRRFFIVMMLSYVVMMRFLTIG